MLRYGRFPLFDNKEERSARKFDEKKGRSQPITFYSQLIQLLPFKPDGYYEKLRLGYYEKIKSEQSWIEWLPCIFGNICVAVIIAGVVLCYVWSLASAIVGVSAIRFIIWCYHVGWINGWIWMSAMTNVAIFAFAIVDVSFILFLKCLLCCIAFVGFIIWCCHVGWINGWMSAVTNVAIFVFIQKDTFPIIDTLPSILGWPLSVALSHVIKLLIDRMQLLAVSFVEYVFQCNQKNVAQYRHMNPSDPHSLKEQPQRRVSCKKDRCEQRIARRAEKIARRKARCQEEDPYKRLSPPKSNVAQCRYMNPSDPYPMKVILYWFVPLIAVLFMGYCTNGNSIDPTAVLAQWSADALALLDLVLNCYLKLLGLVLIVILIYIVKLLIVKTVYIVKLLIVKTQLLIVRFVGCLSERYQMNPSTLYSKMKILFWLVSLLAVLFKGYSTNMNISNIKLGVSLDVGVTYIDKYIGLFGLEAPQLSTIPNIDQSPLHPNEGEGMTMIGEPFPDIDQCPLQPNEGKGRAMIERPIDMALYRRINFWHDEFLTSNERYSYTLRDHCYNGSVCCHRIHNFVVRLYQYVQARWKSFVKFIKREPPDRDWPEYKYKLPVDPNYGRNTRVWYWETYWDSIASDKDKPVKPIKTRLLAVVVGRVDDEHGKYKIRLPDGEITVVDYDQISYTPKSAKNARRRAAMKRAKVDHAEALRHGTLHRRCQEDREEVDIDTKESGTWTCWPIIVNIMILMSIVFFASIDIETHHMYIIPAYNMICEFYSQNALYFNFMSNNAWKFIGGCYVVVFPPALWHLRPMFHRLGARAKRIVLVPLHVAGIYFQPPSLPDIRTWPIFDVDSCVECSHDVEYKCNGVESESSEEVTVPPPSSPPPPPAAPPHSSALSPDSDNQETRHESEPKYIYVKLPDGKNQQVEFQRTKTIAQIKAEVQSRVGLRLSEFNLMFNAYKELGNVSRTLKDFGIDGNTTTFLDVLVLGPGGNNCADVIIPFGPYPSPLFYDEENINAIPGSYGLIPDIVRDANEVRCAYLSFV